MNETKGEWKVSSKSFGGADTGGDIVIRSPRGLVAVACTIHEGLINAEANANLIVSAVNGCKSVNPDCPEHVAEAIKPMYEALKQAEKILSTLLITQGLPPSDSDVVYNIQSVLTLAERRE